MGMKALFVVVALSLAGLAACGSSVRSSAPAKPHFSFSGETTTCRQWTTLMSDLDRDSAAVDLMHAMTSADGKDDASTKDIMALSDGITTACKSYPREKVSKVAATFYVIANPS